MENDDLFATDARLDGERLLTTTTAKNHHADNQRASEASPLLSDSQRGSVVENETSEVWEYQSYLDDLPWRKKPSVN